MRISDWSSDVCSSDLRARLIEAGKIIERDGRLSNLRAEKELGNALETGRKHAENGANGGRKRAENERASRENNGIDQAGPRSEEHTPELQSLMRISYAVFCLKKKNNKTSKKKTMHTTSKT